MKLGILFSGGKDSTYAAFLAKKQGHELVCLISIFSKNKDSFMFHTPAIEMTRKQAKLMAIPLIVGETIGNKEEELDDLEKSIIKAVEKYNIQGIVTGAVESVYQSKRIQDICNRLNLECLNPLWKKNQIELIKELIFNNFDIVVTGVAAFPLDKSWIGRKIDERFLREVILLNKKYSISPAGEGGEFETLVLNCPLFKKRIIFGKFSIEGEGHNWRLKQSI